MIGNLIQIVIAVTLVLIFFVIGFSIYNMEAVRAIKDMGRTKKRVPIFEGVKDLALSQNEIYDTSNPSSSTYIPLVPSVNQLSGIEYTYNFWLYIDHDGLGQTKIPIGSSAVTTDAGLDKSDTILFLRGDKTPYTYKNLCGKDKNDILVKGPLVKLERSMDVLTVEFNTVNSPDARWAGAADTCKDNDKSNDWERMNAHKISLKNIMDTDNLKKKWFMVSVVIQDTNPEDPLPLRNKARCRIYINGTLELDRYVDGALTAEGFTPQVVRRNMGHLHIFPKVTVGTATTNTKPESSQDGKLLMADLVYHNYALSSTELKSIYESGFNKRVAPTVSDMAKKSTQNYLDSMSMVASKSQLKAVGQY